MCSRTVVSCRTTAWDLTVRSPPENGVGAGGWEWLGTDEASVLPPRVSSEGGGRLASPLPPYGDPLSRVRLLKVPSC
jgi:hypothetical protein